MDYYNQDQYFPIDIDLNMLNDISRNSLISYLGIEYTCLDKDTLYAKMPINEHTKQPMGILHGGASVVLAETVGSMAANLMVDRNQYYCVGLEINANHVHIATAGYVHAKASPLHVGKSTHVWQIYITNDQKQLVCVSRHTVAVLKHKHPLNPNVFPKYMS
jgi:1,4-dihydroxy-2-naphthoyl-CoA hydrolase